MDIEEYIAQYAKSKGVKEKDYEHFRGLVLKGLQGMGLRTDRIDYDKFKAIAKRKDAQEIAKKQGVDIDGE